MITVYDAQGRPKRAPLETIPDYYDPDTQPDSPSAYDDEFNDESIAGKWTITNNPGGDNAMSESLFPGYIHVGLAENATDNFDNAVRIHQTPPTGTSIMEFAAKVAISQVGGITGNLGEWACIGVYLGNSVNDEAVMAALELNDADIDQVTMTTGLKGHGQAMDTFKIQRTIAPGEFMYLKLVKETANAYTSANTYKVYTSCNGIIWWEIAYQSKTFVTACDEVGLYYRNPKSQTGTPIVYAIADWFRKVT